MATIVQSPCYQILKRYLKNLCIKDCIPFSITTTLFITYSLYLDNNILHYHALINITENIRKALDDENIGCGVFADLQKAFDTLDHQILLAKLNHYGIPGVSNDWFKYYLSNRCQYVSMSGYYSCCYKFWCSSKISSRSPAIFIIYKPPESSNDILQSSPLF